MSGRTRLDFNLDDFEEPSSKKVNVTDKQAIDRESAFPSREAEIEGQLNIRASRDTIKRFRSMAKKERYTLGAFLEILMNAYESK